MTNGIIAFLTAAIIGTTLIPGKTSPILPYEQKCSRTFTIFESIKIDHREIMQLHELNLLAQLIQAEAGNQDLTGMRYVADVVLNRVDSEIFPNSIEEVIFQEGQFSVIRNGMFEVAGLNIAEECYLAAKLEWLQNTRLDSGILYFNAGKRAANGKHPWKYEDHWFGY